MKEPCFRCKRPTYFNDKIGPLKDGVYCAGHVPTPGPHDPIPHRSNLLYSPKTKGEYPYNLMRPSGP
ncbi:unnamed protein product [Gongylonema pulchrum]|uniref:LIM zinc-binding domain-containing protein n=1 Tax=Gongylonema pulchrum TaxID=637853 RepID=A0A183EBM0_9BILA|nr:unnamed protein product [Gongylonema pulchrum]